MTVKITSLEQNDTVVAILEDHRGADIHLSNNANEDVLVTPYYGPNPRYTIRVDREGTEHGRP